MRRRVALFGLVVGVLVRVAAAGGGVPAAYFGGDVKGVPEKKPGNLSVDPDGNLVFDWEGGQWSAPARQLRTIYVSLSRRSVLVEVPYAWPGAIGKDRKLLLSLRLETEEGVFRRMVFYLPASAPKSFIKRVQDGSGAGVVFESEEARRAIDD